MIYKTLFEVKFLHEFFLVNESGNSVFDVANATDRETFLTSMFTSDHENIGRDISFDFPDEFKQTYRGYYLKLFTTYTGFKVAIQVNKVVMPDNSIQYQPFVSLPDDLNIFIIATKNNSLIDVYSNARISRSVPALYFFSNDNISDAKVFPFITSNISTEKTGYAYEQGELAIDSSNNLQEYYYDQAGALQTNAITNQVKSFVNENDRMLLPLIFDYTFADTTIKNATFNLKDTSGNSITSISINQSTPIVKTTLDFTDKKDQLKMPAVFSLQVSGDNNFSETKNIVFSNSFYDTSSWAIINIKTKVTNADFNLLTDEGYLKWESTLPTGVTEFPAVFLIPVKSRFSHFRYVNDTDEELQLITDLDEYLFKEEKILITQLPVSLSDYFYKVKNVPANSDPVALKYLPNPVSYALQKDAMKRIYMDVIVPQSDLFPVV